jgi:hypothetical protein
MATAGTLLIGASGFLLGQQLGDSGSGPDETVPKSIVTHESRISIPNLRSIGGFPAISTGAGRGTSPPGP